MSQPISSISDLQTAIIVVNNQLASDWDRIRRGGVYDPEKRSELFAKKRRLLNELTAMLNPALPQIEPDTKSLRSSAPIHDSQKPLLARALNTYHRVSMTTADDSAAELRRKMQERVNGFTIALLQGFSIRYKELRENFSDDTTADDPLIASDGTVYLSYCFDSDENSWKIQAGFATDDGIEWGSNTVASMYELGAEIERVITEGGANTPYRHEPQQGA